MKLLWVKSDFLHPTTKGGHIRTLEMLRRLHRRHEVHYVAFRGTEEGLERSREYAARAYPVDHHAPPRTSPAFYGQALAGVVSPLPVSIARYRSAAMRRQVADLLREGAFDSVVCDFLTPAVNIDALARCVLFQHNVETVIWERHAAAAGNPALRWYFRGQARRMLRFEQRVCRAVRHVIAVSPIDAAKLEELCGLREVSAVSTGVDIDYFAPPLEVPPASTDLVFVGSMDWLPNLDGMRYFLAEVLPRIRARRPAVTLAIVGREPTGELRRLARDAGGVTVTGTVPDIRPHLWGAQVSIVPLRIGGGTRLKIYEAMAARIPVVSTTVGAEGLVVTPPADIRIADTPESFAADCLDLLENPARRTEQSAAAWRLVSERFSWDSVTREFEEILLRHAGV